MPALWDSVSSYVQRDTAVEQPIALLCKGPQSKYFRLGGSPGPATATQLGKTGSNHMFPGSVVNETWVLAPNKISGRAEEMVQRVKAFVAEA